MTAANVDFLAIRRVIANWSADVSHDAHGAQAPEGDELYAPEPHAAALDPACPIVSGPRGTGKSFWSGVLGNDGLRAKAAIAYPKLGLKNASVQFGYTGLPGEGINREKLDRCVGSADDKDAMRTFFWATILRAIDGARQKPPAKLAEFMSRARDVEDRESELLTFDREQQKRGKVLLIVYDALDTMATTWPRRRLLTEALLEVVWAMRAYRALRMKLFIRPDQLEDDALQFVELPKLRSGAVRLIWPRTDLYGLLFARLALTEGLSGFDQLLRSLRLPRATAQQILTRQWPLATDENVQEKLMAAIAGPYMAEGEHGYKKGRTYQWAFDHLADAFYEVTPRSFLGLMIGAANHGSAPSDRVIMATGIKTGLRAASKTRVDQLHQEFPWIKVVLTPLAGQLMPQNEASVFSVWRNARTLKKATDQAKLEGFLPPVQEGRGESPPERGLYTALERIGVMFRRKDDRIDMPDLFRVAANLLKKGGTAPA